MSRISKIIKTNQPKNNKRKLTEDEMNNILDFIKPNPYIPIETAVSVVEKTKKSLKDQLVNIEIYPQMIDTLSNKIKKHYISTLIQPGENVGPVMGQSIGEKQTQSNLNTFHKAGSSDKQPVVSKFSELLNATNKPKAPSYMIYFNQGNETVSELRETIGHTLVHLNFKKIAKTFSICVEKEPEQWYNSFYILYQEKDKIFTDCISIEINMDILYEYKLTLEKISKVIETEYSDSFCIFSPDCFGIIDVYFDTRNIELPEEKLVFVTQDNAKEIYLEEVVQPILENITLCGIPGIMNLFFIQNKKEWLVETENANDKELINFKGKGKVIESTKRFKQVLAHPSVDMTRTLSNNVWNIYNTFGIEAVRQYMIDEFSTIMEGINLCHIMLLVDKMTFEGSISSISRYTMRREESGPLGKASFEETLDNFLKAGVFGQEEPTRGVSASIICGKLANVGTGLCRLSVNMEKIMEEESESESSCSESDSETESDED